MANFFPEQQFSRAQDSVSFDFTLFTLTVLFDAQCSTFASLSRQMSVNGHFRAFIRYHKILIISSMTRNVGKLLQRHSKNRMRATGFYHRR